MIDGIGSSMMAMQGQGQGRGSAALSTDQKQLISDTLEQFDS